jgi:hypothetical protein
MARLTAACLAAAILAGPSQAFVAENFKPVSPTGPDSFIVASHGDSVVREFWCAAGDYVLRGLRQPPATRIWRVSAPPQRATEGIEFSISSVGAQMPGIALMGGDGRSLTAAAASQLCERRKIFPDDLRN